MNTKWLIIFVLGLIFFSVTPVKTANACDIELKILKGKKESYQVGDTLVLLVKVALTHRTCPVKMKETKFKLNGIKVIKSTPWKQKAANDWERKLMVVVTNVPKNGKLNLSAIRECEKDGGFGTIKLDVN